MLSKDAMTTTKKPKLVDIERIARIERCLAVIFSRLNDRLDPIYREVQELVKELKDESDS